MARGHARLEVPEFAPLALAATNVGVWEWRPDEDRVFGDENLANMFGFEADDVAEGLPLGRFAEVVDPRDRPLFERRVNQVKLSGGLIVIEYRTRPSPGVFRWILVRGRYYLGEAGELLCGRGIAIDITDSKIDGHVEDRAFFHVPSKVIEEPALLPLDHAADLALALHREALALTKLAPALPSAIALVLELLRMAAVAGDGDA